MNCKGGQTMPQKKNLTVRLDDNVREVLELIANREMRPLANQINFFMKQSIDSYLKQHDLIVEDQTDPETGEHLGLTFVNHPF